PVSPDRNMALICSSTLPPAPNHARPLWVKEGQPCMTTNTSIATTPASVAQASPPRVSSARLSDHQWGLCSTSSSSCIALVPLHVHHRLCLRLFGLFVLLKAGTPPPRLMISPAATLVLTQSANFCTSRSGLAVGSTSQMKRDSGYWRFLMFLSAQGIPFRL